MTDYRLVTYSDSTDHYVIAKHDSEIVIGKLSWDRRSGMVTGADVHPDHQRQGIGTAMWLEAKRLASDTGCVAPRHAKNNQTTAGKAWARKAGR